MLWYIVVGLLLAGILFWRLVLPGMRLTASEAATPTSASSLTSSVRGDLKEWFGEYFWTLLIIVGGVALALWSVNNASVRPADVGITGQKYWLTVLTIWGGLAALIAIHAKSAVAKTLQWVVASVAVAVLVIFPLWGWVTGPATPTTRKVATSCPNVSASEVRSCLVTSEWSNWIQFADGARDNGKQICLSLGPQFERKDEQGVTFWRFRVANGSQEVKFRLFGPEANCANIVL